MNQTGSEKRLCRSVILTCRCIMVLYRRAVFVLMFLSIGALYFKTEILPSLTVVTRQRTTEKKNLFLPKMLGKKEINTTNFEENSKLNLSAFMRENKILVVKGKPFMPENDLLSLEPFPFNSSFKNPCWYNSDGILRCLPYYYLIGARKCGTTDLSARIQAHPNVASPGWKESHWLERERFGKNRSIEIYMDKFQKATNFIESHITEMDGREFRYVVTGESTPAYFHYHFYWPILPGNDPDENEPRYTNFDYINHITPQAKLILLIRDPVERVYSDYIFRYVKKKHKRNEVSLADFHMFVAKMVNKFQTCFDEYSHRKCTYMHNYQGKEEVMINIGFYAIYVADILKVFPPEQLLVIRSEDFSDDIHSTMKTVYNFLDLRPLSSEETKKIMKLPRENYWPETKQEVGPMYEETKRLLYDFYKPLNKMLAKLLNDDKYLYLYSEYETRL